MKTTFTLGCLITALLPAMLATPALAVDLLKQYPTHLVKGDAEPEHAHAWEFQNQDIFRLSHFSLAVGNEFKVETGAADLGIGHCPDGAVWAVLLPREPGTLTSSVAKKEEAIAHVWLRFHPAQIDRIFSPSLVSADGNADLAGAMRAIANSKMTSSWQAGGRAMIPEPKDMTVYVDTKEGAHRFFMVDIEKKTAEYVAAFNKSSESSPLSWETAPPVVIKTVPEAGATDVPPGVTEIQVTFSKEMTDESWSWSTAWENSTPEGTEKPRYDASRRTCALKVNLEPGKTYGWWLNSQRFHGFKDAQGHSAVPYLLTFQTAAQGQLAAAPRVGSTIRANPQTGLPMTSSGSTGIDPATGLPAGAIGRGVTKPIAAGENSAETWSPALAPGETADLQKILNTAKSLADEGSYEEALQRYLWYFDHSRSDDTQRGVRLSFALSDWMNLAGHYPKAKQALIEIRDAEAQRFSDGGGYADLFHEVSAISSYLNDDKATARLFGTVEQKDPALAGQCYFWAQEALIQNGVYEKCLHYLGDPQAAFQQICSSRKQRQTFDIRQAERQEQLTKRLQAMAQTNRAFARVPTLMAPPPFADENFVRETRQLFEILVGAGRKADAEKIQSQAMAILDDARLKSAVSDATEQVLKHSLNNK